LFSKKYNKERSEIYVIEITKKQADYLSKHGCYWHYDIMATIHRRHYYARECPKVFKLLDKQKTDR